MPFNRRRCTDCTATFFPNRADQVRCVPCRTAHSREQHRVRGQRRADSRRAAQEAQPQICAACGREFHAPRKLQYCKRPECRTARNTARMHLYFDGYEARNGEKYVIKHNPETRQRNSAARRARQRGARVGEPFTRQYIGERDSWQCALCGEAIDSTLKWPDPMSQSLEHIVPLALGGEHSKENCTIAHVSCNSRGGTRNAQARARMLRDRGSAHVT